MLLYPYILPLIIMSDMVLCNGIMLSDDPTFLTVYTYTNLSLCSHSILYVGSCIAIVSATIIFDHFI